MSKKHPKQHASHGGGARSAGSEPPAGGAEIERDDDHGSMVSEIRDTLESGLNAGVESAKEAVSTATDALRSAGDKVGTMMHDAQESIAEAGHAVVETARKNPLPLALAGFGVACAGVGVTLLVLNAREEERRVQAQRNGHGRGQGGHGRGQGGRNRGPQGSRPRANESSTASGSSLQRAIGNVSGEASKLAHRAQESIGGATRSAGQAVGRVVEGAKTQAGRAGTALENAYDSNPLAVGAAVIAAGTIIGLALPSTEREDQWLGEGRDQVLGKAKDLAKDAIDKVDRFIHPNAT